LHRMLRHHAERTALDGGGSVVMAVHPLAGKANEHAARLYLAAVGDDGGDRFAAQTARLSKARKKLVQWDGIHGKNLPHRAPQRPSCPFLLLYAAVGRRMCTGLYPSAPVTVRVMTEPILTSVFSAAL